VTPPDFLRRYHSLFLVYIINMKPGASVTALSFYGLKKSLYEWRKEGEYKRNGCAGINGASLPTRYGFVLRMRRERALGDERSIAGGVGTLITLALLMLTAHNVPVLPPSRAIGRQTAPPAPARRSGRYASVVLKRSVCSGRSL